MAIKSWSPQWKSSTQTVFDLTTGSVCHCWDTCSSLLCQMIDFTAECIIIVTSLLFHLASTNDEDAFNKKINKYIKMTLMRAHIQRLPNHGASFSKDFFSHPFFMCSLFFSVIDCFTLDIKSNAWPTKRIIGRFD